MYEEMKKLPYFQIGDSLGGRQKWFNGRMMRLGGCGAKTACDLSVYLALYQDEKALYPFDPEHITREDYVRFADQMRPFLHPRMTGIDRTSIYLEGYGKYLAKCGVTDIRLTSLEGTEDVSRAEAAIRGRIDAGFPVPYLMLYHRNLKYDDYTWHWFICAGYTRRHAGDPALPVADRRDLEEEGFWIRVISYGREVWFPLTRLWETGFRRRGGLILVSRES